MLPPIENGSISTTSFFVAIFCLHGAAAVLLLLTSGADSCVRCGCKPRYNVYEAFCAYLRIYRAEDVLTAIKLVAVSGRGEEKTHGWSEKRRFPNYELPLGSVREWFLCLFCVCTVIFGFFSRWVVVSCLSLVPLDYFVGIFYYRLVDFADNIMLERKSVQALLYPGSDIPPVIGKMDLLLDAGALGLRLRNRWTSEEHIRYKDDKFTVTKRWIVQYSSERRIKRACYLGSGSVVQVKMQADSPKENPWWAQYCFRRTSLFDDLTHTYVYLTRKRCEVPSEECDLFPEEEFGEIQPLLDALSEVNERLRCLIRGVTIRSTQVHSYDSWERSMVIGHMLFQLPTNAARGPCHICAADAHKFLVQLSCSDKHRICPDCVIAIRNSLCPYCKKPIEVEKFRFVLKGELDADFLGFHPCAHCGGKATMRCQCREVYYCNKDCQSLGWREHRRNCSKRKISPDEKRRRRQRLRNRNRDY